ncbi:hypothetical protein F4860DRAFT_497040 [Xylaria cubensis]|nr:hypothetical protein F4860DRAFT_497040 [Xylaria cubensis]
MERSNNSSVVRPRPRKFRRALASCWKMALSIVCLNPNDEINYDSASVKKHEKHDSSSALIPQNCAHERDHEARKYPLCDVGDCRRERIPGTTYCETHICHTNRCGDIRALGSLHCRRHKCRCCNFKAKMKNSYCEAHKCSAPSCFHGKEPDQGWCRQHLCQWTDCNKPPSKGARYCDFHVCGMERCVSKAVSTGNWVADYCCCHTCSADGCLLGVASTGTFCAGHGCLIPGCPNPRLRDDGNDPDALGSERGCCRFHTCVQRGCFRLTSTVGWFCGLHIPLNSGWQRPRVCHMTSRNDLRRYHCLGLSRGVEGDDGRRGSFCSAM